MELTNQGKLARIEVPEGWKEDELAGRSAPSGYLRRFRPQGEHDVELCFYYRGAPLKDKSAAAFLATLNDPPHTLSKEELARLSDVLEDKADPEAFELRGARTSDHNGRRVLVVQGRWQIRDSETLSAYVDGEGSGRIVEEIYYTAPEPLYEKFLKEVRVSLKTIAWTEDPADLLRKMSRAIDDEA